MRAVCREAGSGCDVPFFEERHDLGPGKLAVVLDPRRRRHVPLPGLVHLGLARRQPHAHRYQVGVGLRGLHVREDVADLPRGMRVGVREGAHGVAHGHPSAADGRRDDLDLGQGVCRAEGEAGQGLGQRARGHGAGLHRRASRVLLGCFVPTRFEHVGRGVEGSEAQRGAGAGRGAGLGHVAVPARRGVAVADALGAGEDARLGLGCAGDPRLHRRSGLVRHHGRLDRCHGLEECVAEVELEAARVIRSADGGVGGEQLARAVLGVGSTGEAVGVEVEGVDPADFARGLQETSEILRVEARRAAAVCLDAGRELVGRDGRRALVARQGDQVGRRQRQVVGPPGVHLKVGDEEALPVGLVEGDACEVEVLDARFWNGGTG
ncbi:hypothetical protein DFJ74DRAFT_334932 [Hyaloraphidium curvatum]|nr:hypothetical protein DFJ74DRAFT_334932 [Hyaloraphidium curvatum]